MCIQTTISKVVLIEVLMRIYRRNLNHVEDTRVQNRVSYLWLRRVICYVKPEYFERDYIDHILRNSFRAWIS